MYDIVTNPAMQADEVIFSTTYKYWEEFRDPVSSIRYQSSIIRYPFLGLSIPFVDRNSLEESEVRNKPGCLNSSACNHYLDIFSVNKGFDQGFGRRL